MARKSKTKTATRSKKTPPRPASSDKTPPRFGRYCLTLLLLGAMILAWLSMVSFSPTDPPSKLVYPPKSPVENRVGLVGSYLAYALRYWLGVGAYAGILLLTVWSALGIIGRRVGDLPWRLAGMVLLMAACSGGAWLLNPAFVGEFFESPFGVLGCSLGRFLLERFGPTGSWIVLLIGGCIGLMLSADNLLKALGRRVWQRRNDAAQIFAQLRARKLATAGASESPSPNVSPAPNPPTAPRVLAPGLKPAHPAELPAEAPAEKPEPQPAKKPIRLLGGLSRPDRPKSPLDVGKPDKKPRKKSPAASDKSPARAPRMADLPSMDLLADPEGGYSEAAEIQAVQRKLVLQQTLDDFHIEAKVVGYMTGPVITLFEVSLSPGVKVAQIGNLATDIARALAVPGVRVVPPRFGKDTVGIEVPNLQKEIVRLKELMTRCPQAEKKMTLPLYLGKDAGGDAIVVDLGKMPHMLIAGTTGSGKSVCINTIIMSLLMTRKTHDVRLILVDPKMVEMAAFEKLPHLLCPTINDMKKAEDILEWAVTKMDERYELLREAGVKNLAQFNRLTKKEIYERFRVETDEEKARVPTNLPSYVIIIDELADLMMTSSKEVEAYVIRIAQKARAVGIHLVLATQRPSANVVTGLIKSNMPCRVSFRVASGQESRIVLDSKGAEVLLGQGDMLLLEPGDSSLVRAQGTFVDDSEIHAVVKELEKTGDQSFDTELMKIQSGATGELSEERDDLFDQAVEIVLATERGSVSLLQRRMQIGYGRASRIIDQMAEAGILGGHKGSQARECMITLEDWEQMKASIVADRSGANSLNGEPMSV
ncbi:MAG: DNA translocase FtsK 4TM domain-containing protein [Phycisphaerae bacterium]|nr:DNA translocase FtsK 4TM domain-containing protein [Phycisphaerae bacterium]